MSGWYPASRPKRVADGLKARSTRGAIGTSWWSRRFLDVLESLAIGGRLARGRTYARQGQVMALEVRAGTVSATVQGSRRKPYDVTIGVEPLTAQEWDAVEQALVAQALPCAKLLAGEVPPELETIFGDAGTSLFPTDVDDLEQACNCPDWGVPCKHLAATFYLLAEAFDADPFLILRWRGRERDELLSRLRTLRSGGAVDDHGAGDEAAPAAGARAALDGMTWPGNREARFWQPPPPLPARPPVLTSDPDVLLRQLPEPGAVIGGAELVTQLRELYRRGQQDGVSPPDRDAPAARPRPRR